VDVYATEEEQAEQVKKWLKENGPPIVIGLILGLGGLSGWRYWQASQRAQAEAASSAFEQLTVFVRSGKMDQARKFGEKVINDFPKSSYAEFAALTLAKVADDQNDLAGAAKQLQWAIDHSKFPEVTRLARLRLARVWLSEGKLDDAWNAAQKISDKPPSAALSELKGDILVAQGKTDEARRQYLEATAQAGDKDPNEADTLSMKLNNLGTAPVTDSKSP
jgi:predicted negative regulator of RcsB-dependent stress response